jgi:hypothetical protein
VQGTSSINNTGVGVSAINDSGAVGLFARGKPAGRFAGLVEMNDGLNITGFIKHAGDALIQGTLTVTTDIVLRAADCAEEFDIGVADEIEPGTVMVLDGNGSLRPSDQAYDRKVAGVISGAGDYRPGMILDRRDASRQRMPVALVGKVYCKVDAAYSPVGLGDLLTTSPTVGHAMRALDPQKAFGAVVGKALQPLTSGQGLIPVLVALQ